MLSELTITELKTEIVSQILKSKSFQKLIFDNNGFYVDFDDIAFVEVWYEWKYDNASNSLKQDYKKWVNTIDNEPHKPSQETEYSNLFLAGAHTKTSIGVWSMEGATESGKLVASLILKRRYNDDTGVYYYKHQEPWVARIIQKIDDALYAIKLPNVIVVLVFLVVISLLMALFTNNV